MKKITLTIAVMLCALGLTAQELKMNFSNVGGSGWAVLSSTPQTITLKEKTQTYLLISDSFKVSEFKGFKITFGEKPEGVHIYIRGLNDTGEDKMNFVNLKLDGLTMTHNISNIVDVNKLGLRFAGNSTSEQTTVKVDNFYLIDINGNLIPSTLPSVNDAIKLKNIWSREFGQSAEIIFTGNYNRELEWSAKNVNDFNALKIELNQPLAQDCDVRIKMSKGKKEQTGYKTILKGATSFSVNLKEYKDSGAEITRLIFVGRAKGDIIDFKSVILTK